MNLITHKDTEECHAFFNGYFTLPKKALFVGTLGFNDACLYFPRMICDLECFDFLFLIEKRPEVSPVLEQAAEQNRQELMKMLSRHKLSFESVLVIADDTASTAGRNAATTFDKWLANCYTDVIVDATTMSRGVCFPLVKQAYESKTSAHVVIADRIASPLKTTAMYTDSPQYMHGFQADMDTDKVKDAIKLWIPQLSENNHDSLERIFRKERPDEVAPILPFPAVNPRRGDELMREFHDLILSDWDVNLLDIIYAHESDPTDVFETIKRIHCGREVALDGFQKTPPRTILSPSGSKMGSLGMLFAAIALDLPVVYSETMGYRCEQQIVPPVSTEMPDRMWHAWLRHL
ncbi:hypothetical protein C9382_26765 [Pseudomonas aylmerensis]|uniref:Uncharacterized protein n=1 Tax=Pseudomonas aylmerensis TaxID=1869229 RepID=A0A2T4FMJ8_9PSED|nr:hypothetical protein [Pseudomonas aylmerensis]OCW25090.1 hypothetical protein BBG20_16730 [Pseudomonas aylmerensis]PTC24647.1 hypothetical protein C9382_26765 [Pseudomonas aylmerensis]